MKQMTKIRDQLATSSQVLSEHESMIAHLEQELRRLRQASRNPLGKSVEAAGDAAKFVLDEAVHLSSRVGRVFSAAAKAYKEG